MGWVVLSIVLAHPIGGLTKRVGTLSAEQNCGHAQPGRVGHERKAVLRRHWNQGLGRGLLRSTETVSRGPAQVSHGTSAVVVFGFTQKCSWGRWRKETLCLLVSQSSTLDGLAQICWNIPGCQMCPTDFSSCSTLRSTFIVLIDQQLLHGLS